MGGSVADVTTQFETSVGRISDSVSDTYAVVDAEIVATERTLVAKLSAVETELQGVAADASAQVATVSMIGLRAKSRLLAAMQGVDVARGRFQGSTPSAC